MKKYLIIMRHPPHGSIHVQEQLDIILTLGAFDRMVSLLFLDESVFQLFRGQSAEQYEHKETLAIFDALALYDVHDLWVETESLIEKGLVSEQLTLPVKTIARVRVSQFMSGFDVILGG
jgi:tRNA 2-thiouridine synthesizing protein C